MKKVIAFVVLSIVFAGISFATDYGTGVGFSFYGTKDSKLSRQSGFTANVNIDFYSPNSFIDVYAGIGASFGKYGYYYSNKLDSIDGLHAFLLFGGKFDLGNSVSLKLGAGAVSSVQIANKKLCYSSSKGYYYDADLEVKFGPSGYVLLDFYTGNSVVMKIGSLFGTYLYGRVFDGSSSELDWDTAAEYSKRELFIWPQASVSIQW